MGRKRASDEMSINPDKSLSVITMRIDGADDELIAVLKVLRGKKYPWAIECTKKLDLARDEFVEAINELRTIKYKLRLLIQGE